jgi:hypothetical protein
MALLIFTVVGLILYFLADWLLNRIEIAMKRRLEYRTLVFFAILFGLALAVFPLIRILLAG